MAKRLTPEERERRWMWRGIVSIAQGWEAQQRKLVRTLEDLGPRCKMALIPNPALAGPCSACLAYTGAPRLITDVPLMPLRDCSHPDQCCCLWRPLLSLDG